MKKKVILGLLGVMITCTMLACSTTAPEVETSEIAETVEELAVSRVDELNNKRINGDITKEEMQELAGLYKDAGLIKAQRNILEECVLLFGEDSTVLNDIWVNVAEENIAVSEALHNLFTFLNVEDTRAEAIDNITGSDWEQLMASSLKSGCRNYFSKDEAIKVSVGYNESGVLYTDIWCEYSNGEVVYVFKEGSVVKILNGKVDSGKLTDIYYIHTFDEKTGDITIETMGLKDGNIDGEYELMYHAGDGEASAYDMMTMLEEFGYTDFKGSFDGKGCTTTTQPSEEELKSLVGEDGKNIVVYALTSNKKVCLFKEGTIKDAIFNLTMLGIKELPTVEEYDAPAKEESVASQNVKIYGNEVYYFDGTNWVNCGDVYDMLDKDKLRAGEKTDSTGEEVEDDEEGEAEAEPLISMGTVAVKTADKPAQKKQPATQAVATPAPVQEPAAVPASDGGSSGGSSDSGSSDSSSSDSSSSGGDSSGSSEPSQTADEPEIQADDGDWLEE